MSTSNTIWSKLQGWFNSIIISNSTTDQRQFTLLEEDPIGKYLRLKRMYDNNHLYEDVTKLANLNSTFVEALKPLRTTVNRSVEFYVSKMYPTNEMLVETDNESVEDSIQKLSKWSNFKGKRSSYLRYLALFGDLFLKVNVEEDKIYYESINPMYVSAFEEDSRGFLQWIRIDMPVERGDQIRTYTEYWTKDEYMIWEHDQLRNIELDQLGEPLESGLTSEFGIDFVPFVHMKFKDTGDLRGKSCVDHAIDKIDESNRQATRLSQMLFRHNKPLFILSKDTVDSNGSPIPATSLDDDNIVDIKDNTVLSLSGRAKLDSLIPNINYDAALNVLNAMMEEIKEDLPELRYYALQDRNLSGKALALLLGAATDRANEARNNFVEGLVRANEMGLTMGSFFGLFPTTVGSFEDGDFEHSIMVEDIFGNTLDEKADTMSKLLNLGLSLSVVMSLTGFSEEEIIELTSEEENQEEIQEVEEQV